MNKNTCSLNRNKCMRMDVEETASKETADSDDKHLEEAIVEEVAEPQAVAKVTKRTAETPKVQWAKQKRRYSSQPVYNEKHEVS